MKFVSFLALYICIYLISYSLSETQHNLSNDNLGYVSKNSVNLRSEPKNASSNFGYDSLQNSQLLLGDRIQIIGKVTENWLEVRALDQARFSNGTWHPYDGYLQINEVWQKTSELKSNQFAIVQSKRAEIFSRLCSNPGCLLPDTEVSMGTIFRFVDYRDTPWGWIQVGTEDGAHKWFIRANDILLTDKLEDKGSYPFIFPSRDKELRLRDSIVTNSFKLVGGVYFWGGRSSYNWKEFISPDSGEKVLSGVDCSGLVGLSYQSQGYILPRDAHDMYLKAEIFNLSEGLPGDLFFFYKPSADRVTHVMMMVDDTHIIESTSGVNASLSTSIETRFGRKYKDLEYGQEVDGYKLYWGRFIKSTK